MSPTGARTLKVLLIEDNPEDAALVLRALERGGFSVNHVRVAGEQELRSALRGGPWDVVLSDYALPQFSGEEALRLVRQLDCDAPFIFVSGQMGEEAAVEAMRSGAQDYVMKDKLARLVPAVERELRDAAIRREARESEVAIRESENKYRHLFESLSDAALVFVEDTGKIIDANAGAEALLGCPRHQILGRDHASFYTRPPDADFRASLQPHPGEREVEVLRGDGARVPVLVSMSRVQFHGRVLVLALLRDITTRRQLEERYRQAQKMEAVGRLAGGIAHDFNNLLVVIQMQSSLLLADGGLDPAAKEGVQQVMVAAERAAGLTKQLLTFSRRGTPQTRDIDLGEVVGSISKLLRRVLGEDIVLETRFAPGLLVVNADPGMMEQVIMNLAVNARDAMPRGGRLEISLESVDAGKARLMAQAGAAPEAFVCMEVSDSGCGIAPENMPRIFEPFFTTKEPGRGTGLGLATVFGIVEQHRGWIEVQSELNRGTTFRIFLPAVRKPAAREGSKEGFAPVKGGSETVLLVEDEDAVRSVTRAALEHFGYRVLEAGSAAAALQLFESQGAAIQLLLTDLVMPGGMSGNELADVLLGREPRLKVIFASGYSDEPIWRGIERDQGRKILQKPYSVRDLGLAVRRCLDGS